MKYISYEKNSAAGAVEVGVQGVQLHTQYLAAFFHKLSGKKKFLKLDKIWRS